MAKTRRTTFGALSKSLRRLGFEAIKTSGHVIFKHKTGRPVILLPAYQSPQTIKPIHEMMVWKQLVDSGLIKGSGGSAKFSLKSGSPTTKRRNVANALKVKT
jgi:predicted RNA binding protein YcfA (HicA-like mRNA interferase family)